MKKSTVKLTALTLMAIISASTSASAMEIPKESIPASADPVAVEIVQNLIGDILDEVANGMGGGDARLQADAIIMKACESEGTNGYGYGILSTIAHNAISTIRDEYLRPEYYEKIDTEVKELISDLIADVENGGDYDAAYETAISRIPTNNISYQDKYKRAKRFLLEAQETYLSKQTVTEAPDSVSGAVSGEKNVNVFVNGDAVVFDVQPVIISDRTMIPMRKLANAIGISDDNVMYDGEARKAMFINGSQTIILTIDNANAQVNGENVTLDAPATIVSDRTLVPLRFISETFGYNVDYTDDGATLNVYLTK